jgi:outer membrane lipoprotein SlyB
MKTKFILRAVSVSIMFAGIAACTPPEAASSPTSGPVSTTIIESCSSCGVVRSITPVTQQGGSTGTGAVIGAVVGGVAGNQVGSGNGNKIATAAGVIGGALLGNNIEQKRNTATWYNVVIEMDDGGQQSIAVQDPVGISPGSAVNVYGDNISLR